MLNILSNAYGREDAIGGGGVMLASGPVPASQPAQAPPATQMAKRGGGCVRWLLAGCVLVLVACACVSIGGFVAFRSGMITPQTALNLIGLGPGDIEVDNFRDDTIQVSILQLAASRDSTPAQADLELAAFDVKTYRAQQPGKYQVNFGTTANSNDLGACTLTIRSGDQFQFVTLPDKIVVNRVNNPPSVGSDLIVASSSLCR